VHGDEAAIGERGRQVRLDHGAGLRIEIIHDQLVAVFGRQQLGPGKPGAVWGPGGRAAHDDVARLVGVEDRPRGLVGDAERVTGARVHYPDIAGDQAHDWLPGADRFHSNRRPRVVGDSRAVW